LPFLIFLFYDFHFGYDFVFLFDDKKRIVMAENNNLVRATAKPEVKNPSKKMDIFMIFFWCFFSAGADFTFMGFYRISLTF